MMKLLVITFTGMKVFFFAHFSSADVIQNNFDNKHPCYIKVVFLIKKTIMEVRKKVAN